MTILELLVDILVRVVDVLRGHSETLGERKIFYQYGFLSFVKTYFKWKQSNDSHNWGQSVGQNSVFYEGAVINPLSLPLPGSCKLVIIEIYSILRASLGTKA